jgi:hypothetical protein
MPKHEIAVPAERIEQAILLIRDQKVMLDRDLAALYEVETRALNQAVRRHLQRFPEDFMFQLSPEEFQDWKSQIVTSNPAAKMSLRKRPYAFTELGVAMLSSILHSDRAIEVNIAIMRAFVKLRDVLATHKEFGRKLEDIERKLGQHDEHFRIVFEAIRQLMARILVNRDAKVHRSGARTSIPAGESPLMRVLQCLALNCTFAPPIVMARVSGPGHAADRRSPHAALHTF